jgi:hypothetical protein
MDQSEFIQESVQRRIDEDIARRTRVHQKNVVRLEAAQAAAATLGVEAVATRPLVMLAHGDSWFDYPLTGNGLPFADTDVIAQLRRIGPRPPTILNLAHHGDASTDALSLPKQERLIAALRNPMNWPSGRPDAILFSAGGNDIAGEQFCIFLDFNDGVAAGLNANRFKKALGMVEAGYRSLFALRDRIAPGVPIFGHGYDFPIPNGAHPACSGPWLKPSLDFCRWSVAQGTKIAKEALTAFQSLLETLAAEPANNFHLVETQGTLKPADWANELHPEPPGFKKIAKKFSDALDAHFAGIV